MEYFTEMVNTELAGNTFPVSFRVTRFVEKAFDQTFFCLHFKILYKVIFPILF